MIEGLKPLTKITFEPIFNSGEDEVYYIRAWPSEINSSKIADDIMKENREFWESSGLKLKIKSMEAIGNRLIETNN